MAFRHVREIMRKHPTPVLMFSSLTYEGARVTLDALEAGAVDFLPKNFEEIARDTSQLQKILIQRILDVAGSRPGGPIGAYGPARPAAPAAGTRRRVPRRATGSRLHRPVTPEPVKNPGPDTTFSPGQKNGTRHYSVVAIGTSTGGPVALQKVLTALPASFPGAHRAGSAYAGQLYPRVCRAAQQVCVALRCVRPRTEMCFVRVCRCWRPVASR